MQFFIFNLFFVVYFAQIFRRNRFPFSLYCRGYELWLRYFFFIVFTLYKLNSKKCVLFTFMCFYYILTCCLAMSLLDSLFILSYKILNCLAVREPVSAKQLKSCTISSHALFLLSITKAFVDLFSTISSYLK